MKDTIDIVFRDETHLRAHLGDFALSLEAALDLVRSRLATSVRENGFLRFDFETPQIVGRTGLAALQPWTRGDFWARRIGRSLPSHLIVGEKKLTRRLCVWGYRRDEGTFVLHTLYPGRVAPREIHDPELPLADLPAALAFWSRHAIIVSRGEWEA